MTRSKNKKSTPTPISDLLEQVFKGEALEQRLKEGKIWEIWKDVVGEQIADRAQPISIRNGILTIGVAGSAWMQQLTFLKKEILNKLNELAGEQLVKEIYLKAATMNNPANDAIPAEQPRRRLTEHELKEIQEISAELEDQDLRDIFVNLLKTHRSTSPK